MKNQPSTVAQGPGGETAEYVFVTPELAVSWLALNIDNNRNVRKSRINGYVRDIQSDRWVVTGEAIKFDTAGQLVDGQNRCQAIVAAGKGAWVLVVRGISEDALVVLDSGSARNAGDMLVITGLADRADAKDVGAIARLYSAYQAGDVKHAASNLGGSTGITKSELADAVLAIPDIEFAARHARGMYRYLRLPVSALGVAFLEFSKLDVDDTAEFFNRIRDGIQNGPGDPFLTLARRVSNDLQAGASRRIVPGQALFYLFRTWNAFRERESLVKLQIGSPQAGFTPIPVPK
ncbi:MULTISPECIES: hypothetical protein [unclassified Microbacterium]|uniref:hypothetical protein n=1 Tax=unclassified Microbacterium TaxID=2609290 RepID=UPI001604EB0D|nr:MULTISPECIES: hypothetical protein [unclassified Microbacterium]QNA92706.1 hypothetical protein G4G29_10540 [Microbacterium sp. Se63.02b]QYM62840.1 hypothetical protein K1X59_10575 [Microbacterium sp. Se5.02b]